MLLGPRVLFLSNVICITAYIPTVPTSGPTRMSSGSGILPLKNKNKKPNQEQKTGMPDGI